MVDVENNASGCVSSCQGTTFAPCSTSASVESSSVLPTPRDFYQRFVRKRTPVIFRHQAATIFENPKLFEDLKVSNLLEISRSEGSSTDVVEVNMVATKADGRTSFSPLDGSRALTLPWATLCESLSSLNGVSPYYMTTQTFPLDDEGRPAVCSWLSELLIRRKILPLRPKLAGNLIPMSCAGIWLGKTNQDTQNASNSSGLHHDRHDNIYGVIAGKKHIRIAPPQAVRQLRTVGTLHTCHTNGRIVYHEDLRCVHHDDASCPIRPDGALASVEKVMELEMRRDAIEESLDGLSELDGQRAKLEQERDGIEEELLDHERAEDVVSEQSDDNEHEGGETPRKKAKLLTEEEVPSNFVIQECETVKFENIELLSGDVLYLPAGWFHEVISAGNAETDDGVHLAVNYWFHPPDMAATTSFEQPYESKFWQRDWDARQLGG